MAPEREWAGTPLWYSVARSLCTHYWLFTLVVLAFALWGAALAPATDWRLTGLLLVAIALGIEGMHDVDLSDPTVAVDVDPAVQRPIGYALITAGIATGAYLAHLTTWWFLAFVAVQAVAGLAYNAEWFDGRLHDLEAYGWATAAVTLGAVPVLAGFYVNAETIGLAALAWAAVAAAYSVGILHVYQAVKLPALYDRMGVQTTRTENRSREEVERLAATGVLLVLVATIGSGAAFALIAGGV